MWECSHSYQVARDAYGDTDDLSHLYPESDEYSYRYLNIQPDLHANSVADRHAAANEHQHSDSHGYFYP
jgi:hypothetical protein